MEKSRAIELLEHLAWDRDIERNPYGDALNMAIEALKAQHSQEGTTSDTISRQATIDAVNNAFDRETLLTGFVRSIAVRAIRDMPTIQPEPKWIPVSERLPEIGGEYLVSVRWYREDDIDINVYDYDARCKEWNDGESCGQRVIAWMPLPTPYKPNNK